MKKPLLLPVLLAALVLLALSLRSQPIAYSSFIQTNLHTVGTNITWNGTNIPFKRITLIGMKAGGISNAAAVYVGARSNETYYVIHPGERHTIEIAPPLAGANGQSSTWWLRTPTTGDGLFCIWNP